MDESFERGKREAENERSRLQSYAIMHREAMGRAENKKEVYRANLHSKVKASLAKEKGFRVNLGSAPGYVGTLDIYIDWIGMKPSFSFFGTPKWHPLYGIEIKYLMGRPASGGGYILQTEEDLNIVSFQITLMAAGAGDFNPKINKMMYHQVRTDSSFTASGIDEFMFKLGKLF